ncbi:MAG: heme/hemin ABC transporter substrate-binding protein [Actinomycetota bacterium]
MDPKPALLGTLAPITETPRPVLPVTSTNADGSRVTVADLSRIVPLAGTLAETLFTLGLGNNVVARDITATFKEAEHLPVVTRVHDVSAESVLSLIPTVVLATADTGPPEAMQHIRDAGVPVLVFGVPTSVEQVPDQIVTVASALGLAKEGKALARRTEQQIRQAQSAIPESAEPPKVAFLYMRGQAGVYLIAGPQSGADSMIKAAGARDAGTEMGLSRAFTPLTSEALVKAAPDVILMTTTGLASVGGIEGLVQIAGIAQTPAGRDRRIVTEEDGLLFSFGARTPQALANLIGKLYPVA